LGGLYLHNKDYEKAISNFLKAIELSPNLDEAYGELGQAYLETGQKAKAVKAFEDALKINPNNPIHLNNLNALKTINENLKQS
jgi:Flp pilus assembly protein TadD